MELEESIKRVVKDYPGGRMVKNLPAIAGDMGSIPGLERFYMLHGS